MMNTHGLLVENLKDDQVVKEDEEEDDGFIILMHWIGEANDIFCNFSGCVLMEWFCSASFGNVCVDEISPSLTHFAQMIFFLSNGASESSHARG